MQGIVGCAISQRDELFPGARFETESAFGGKVPFESRRRFGQVVPAQEIHDDNLLAFGTQPRPKDGHATQLLQDDGRWLRGQPGTVQRIVALACFVAAQAWLRAAPAEDDVRTQGGVLGIGRWPHAKVAPCPSGAAAQLLAERPRGRRGGSAVDGLVKKASKMGDYLRYALFDKYFKEMGCQDPSCPAAEGYGGAHYLLSWYYAWGGSLAKAAGWSWRIGASASHSGYQNPFAAYVLAKEKAFKPASPNAARDWTTSLGRQLEFYRWLQSAEGGMAGGATNSWRGRYAAPPAGTTTFYKMAV